MKTRITTALVIVVVLLSGAGLSDAARKGSKQNGEDTKQRVVETTRLLEAEPFRKDAKKLREWLTNWLYTVPDVAVMLCSSFLGPVVEEQQKNNEQLFMHSAYAQAVFVIENPDQAHDSFAEFRAGVLGTLRLYESMLAADPKSRLDHMDHLIELRENGQLDDYIREKIKACG